MLGNMRRVATATNKSKSTTGDGNKSKAAKQGENMDMTKGKRQGDILQDPTQKRRAAFGDITNAYADKPNVKDVLKKSKIPTQKPVLVKASTKESKVKREKKWKTVGPKVPSVAGGSDSSAVSLSQESLSSQDSSSSSSSQESITSSQESVEDLLVPVEEACGPPEGVEDIDKENLTDPAQVSLYAFSIFNYYKEREAMFQVEPYLSKQKHLTASMRAILVDWLVEVQENFELNHETLYLAVKLVDLYVSKKSISKEILQLVGAASLFIACKFDVGFASMSKYLFDWIHIWPTASLHIVLHDFYLLERCPPLVEDFLYICDDAYKRREFLAMERSVLITVGFDIGMPLSYRFLRRYAKCCKASMETLTLGRFILEMSLMEYNFINIRESKIAAASLLLAMRMKQAGEWTKSMEYYTGYTASELTDVLRRLNSYISAPPKQLVTIISKYSHKVFYEVAKTPALKAEDIV